MIKIAQHFLWMPFIAGLAFGLIAITFRKPDESQRVPKWPHPSNIGQFTYRDKNNLCYTFTDEEVSCTTSKVKDYTIEN